MKESASVFSEKSGESMSSARACFEMEYYNSCVNRAYYGMFQIAVAIFFKSGYKPKSKNSAMTGFRPSSQGFLSGGKSGFRV